ncbi:YaiO family outer membrane beta-barrel protein [Flavobacterium sp. K5-23]|uniref:YaiO family outer membrane beta-barrel protein n=1 Tax=Flavobacterium sp. K5-23 TaxID=2746225 RepID=UPI00200ED888|nr:YaiO family outer membrane beta-barrel protein [Flavobacterium sp. K5-23]UQD56431.1 YaiO family outer membrane beta-barrel protein [Flavobacterium sp. K5-23]
MKIKTTIKLSFLLVFLSVLQINGQETIYNGNPDTSFETARKLAFNQQRKQAQDTLLHILTKYPNYTDIRSFLATTYSWDGDYKKARKEFASILDKDPKNKETWIAAIKNESWGEFKFKALEMANESLKHFPNDPELLYLKASAQESTNNPLEALSTIESILDKNPEDQKALDYKSSLNQTLRVNTVGIRSAVDVYSDVFDPMQFHSLKLSRITKYGSIIAKLNLSRRFNENGSQFEVDLYPRIANGLYAYLNLGLSKSFLFPDVRYGAELYKSLPHSLEVSLGFRTLKYSTTTNIYTGAIGWYTGNSYWSLRPYFTPGEAGTSSSAALNYRKYRSNAENYISFTYSMGTSPEINQFQFNDSDSPIINLQSQRFNVGYYFTTNKNKNTWGAQFDLAHQEIIFDPGNYFWIYSVSLSWDLKFK